MKTIKLLFTATVVAIVAIATAVEKPKMNVIPLTADRAIVSITNENAAYFELSVKSINGDVVYYKQSNKPLTKYQKIFDFENLTNGNYLLDLKVNDTNISKEFEVASNGIYVGNSSLSIDPYFAYNDNVLKFSFLNFKEENFNLNIYNDKGLVYESKIGKNFAMSNGYDLSKLEGGKYQVYLSSNKSNYVYSLVK